MGFQAVRFQYENKTGWGVVSKNFIHVLPGTYPTLKDFLKNGMEEARNIQREGSGTVLSLEDVTLLSPVTKPAKIICQGANYAAHREEVGFDGNRPPFNLIFSKADSALTGPYSEIIRPRRVRLLDYEIELGLIIGKEITEPVRVTEESLKDYVCGLVIVNDLSARDVQFLEGQWLKGKSFRTFAPSGPYLYLLDEKDYAKLGELELKLWVNGELRQSACTDQLLYQPAETIAELSEIMDLSPGDLIATGTAGGVAMNLTTEELANLISPELSYDEKERLLLDSQLNNEKYLQNGDVIRCTIRSKDGTIDLGEQRTTVRAE